MLSLFLAVFKNDIMKTFILKYEVCNHIDFPIGTIVKLVDNENFMVVEGKLKGQTGCVANGLNGWLMENNSTNKKLLNKFKTEQKKINLKINELDKEWDALPTVDVAKNYEA